MCFRKEILMQAPWERCHHQCGFHARQQRWRRHGWYWSPESLGLKLSDIGYLQNLPSPCWWASCQHPPCSSSQPGVLCKYRIGNGWQTWLSRRGWRRETALPPALYEHLRQTHFHHLIFQHWWLLLKSTSQSGQLGHSCRQLLSHPCPGRRGCLRCSRGRTWSIHDGVVL